jgi:hypothetical protein
MKCTGPAVPVDDARHIEPFRRNAMSATRNPAASDPDASLDDDPAPPLPDEDGPHDVPDETVIEKTLPTKPVADDGGGAPP